MKEEIAVLKMEQKIEGKVKTDDGEGFVRDFLACDSVKEVAQYLGTLEKNFLEPKKGIFYT